MPGFIFFKDPFQGAYFGGAYIRCGLSTEGNLLFQIDWASVVVGSILTVFALFYVVFELSRGLCLVGRFNGGFVVLPLWGLIFRGAYTWWGLFSKF